MNEVKLAQESTRQALQAHTTSNGRNKMFNCSFKIFKKKEVVPTNQIYKVGQHVEVKVSFIDDSKKFFVQPLNRRNDLIELEKIIDKYATTLLEGEDVLKELKAYQNNATKFDVVIAKSSFDSKWRRAVLVDKLTSDQLHYADEYEDLEASFRSRESSSQRKQKYNYYEFFLIDWGKTDIVKTPLDDKIELFILPMIDRIISVGCFALMCSLNESQIKHRKKYDELVIANHELFDKKFKSLENMTLMMRISQLVTINAQIEAIVELFYQPSDGERLLAELESLSGDKKSLRGSNHTLTTVSTLSTMKASRLSCVQYITKVMEAELLQNEVP
jgi:hypothetical protein